MPETPHDLTVHGTNSNSGWYTFLLAYGGAWTARGNTEHPDRIEQNGRRASGKVVNGKDSYRFGGVLIGANFDGDVSGMAVEINGKRYDPRTVIRDWQQDAGVSEFPGGGSGGSGGGGDGGDSGTGNSGETVPEHRDTGGSDAANRSGSDCLAADGGYVVSPGELQGALDDLHDASGDGPGNERRSHATLEPGATFDPGETVHIPRNMVVDASGASIVPSASYDLFTFDLGSVLVRPYVNLRGVGDGNSYDARVFTFDPNNVTYGGPRDERNVGYVDKDAWKPRDGQPHNKYRFLEHTRQNQFGNGAGVKGGATLAHWRDRSTLFYYHQNQNDDGWHNSSLALFECSHSARGVAYPVVIDSRGEKGYINDVVVRGYYAGWKTGITIMGNETARKNRFLMDMQPQDGVSEHMMVTDNPTAQRNYFRGCSCDPSKASGPMWLIKRATGQNVLQSLTGHGNGILEDRTGGSNRVTNPF